MRTIRIKRHFAQPGREYKKDEVVKDVHDDLAKEFVARELAEDITPAAAAATPAVAPDAAEPGDATSPATAAKTAAAPAPAGNTNVAARPAK
jgi:hypothetical protein